MQIQLSTEFALHGLLYLAANKGDRPIQLPEIAAATKVKESYLRKLFLQLVKAGILNAYKGSSGGYSLRMNPDQISFYDILKAVEGASGSFRCYADYRSCELHPSCPIIEGFGEAFDLFFDRLKRITLANVLNSEPVKATAITWMLKEERTP